MCLSIFFRTALTKFLANFRFTALLASLLLTNVVTAFAVDSFSGIYTGEMQITDGERQTIPLAASLTLTAEDEVVVTPTGTEIRKVIDGAFLVDGEGGPYAFVKVTLEPESSRIDMRYNRIRVDPTAHAPSSFRLMGYLKEGNIIEGDVSSGIRGIIGKFTLKKSRQTALIPLAKYIGKWTGKMRYFDGSEPIASLILQPSRLMYTNPPDFEFEYTRGHIGYLDVDDVQYPISELNIDYLRRKITIHHKQPQNSTMLTLLGQLDPLLKTLSGVMNSTLRGPTAEFVLEKNR